VTNHPTSPTPRLVSIDRRQILLRTVDVEKLIDEDHSARSVWELVGRLDLGLYHAQIEAVEGGAGRNHTDPQLLVSLWLYAYSRGISSAREVARQCEFEPGFQWLCGLQAISHRTLSGFRSENKAALDDLFVQVLGMLSAEGLISLERVTLDGTKIKANAGGNSFRRKEKLEAHLELAREQVRILNLEGEEKETPATRQAAARRRAARQRASRLEAAVREVERLQAEKKHDRKDFGARASGTDPDAHVMRNGEGGTVPSYNVQLLTDVTHGLVVNVEATTDAIDYRQLQPALERCERTLGKKPKQIVADGDYTNHASVQAAAACGVDFYGSWQDSWKPTEHDAQGRSAEFLASAFPYDAKLYLSCWKGPYSSRSAKSWQRRTYARVPRAQGGMSQLPAARPVRSTGRATRVEAVHHASRRTCDDDGVQGEDGDRRGTTDLRETLADRGVPACLD
jgi:transposase